MDFSRVSREQLELLLTDFAKLWPAHDGTWFEKIEKEILA